MKNKSILLTLLLLAIIATVAILILVSRDSGVEPSTAGETKLYTGTGYQVNYPADWAIDISGGQQNVVVFTSNDLRTEVIIFSLDRAAEKDIRDAIDIVSEQPITIAGTAGTRIIGENLESGENAEIVFVPGQGSALYALAGSGATLGIFLESFKLLP